MIVNNDQNSGTSLVFFFSPRCSLILNFAFQPRCSHKIVLKKNENPLSRETSSDKRCNVIGENRGLALSGNRGLTLSGNDRGLTLSVHLDYRGDEISSANQNTLLSEMKYDTCKFISDGSELRSFFMSKPKSIG